MRRNICERLNKLRRYYNFGKILAKYEHLTFFVHDIIPVFPGIFLASALLRIVVVSCHLLNIVNQDVHTVVQFSYYVFGASLKHCKNRRPFQTTL